MKNEIEHSLCLFIIIILLQLDNIFIKLSEFHHFQVHNHFNCSLTVVIINMY